MEMENEPRFRPLYPTGERKPDPNVTWIPKNREKARERERALQRREAFVSKPPRAPEKCPLCQTLASDYRAAHNGEELLKPGGHPFICAACGNMEWNV